MSLACFAFLVNLMVFVHQVKSDPFKKDSKKEAEDKTGSNKVSGDKRISAGLKTASKWGLVTVPEPARYMFSCGNGRCSSVLLKPLHRIQASSKKEEKKPAEKDNKESSKKQESKSTKSDAPSSSSVSDPKKDEKKHGRKFTNSVLIFPSTFGKFTLCLWCNELNLCFFVFVFFFP